MKFCGKCGKQIPATFKFCPYCGFDLNAESIEPAPQASAPLILKKSTATQPSSAPPPNEPILLVPAPTVYPGMAAPKSGGWGFWQIAGIGCLSVVGLFVTLFIFGAVANRAGFIASLTPVPSVVALVSQPSATPPVSTVVALAGGQAPLVAVVPSSTVAPTAIPAAASKPSVQPTAIPTSTPLPAPTRPPTAVPTPVPQAIALGQPTFQQGNSIEVNYVFFIENPNQRLVLSRAQYQVTFYAADGKIVKSDDDSFYWLYPGQKMGIAESAYMPDGVRPVRMDMQVVRTEYEAAEPVTWFRTENLNWVPDRSYPKITGVIRNPAAKEFTSLYLSGIAYDAGGKVIGSGEASVRLLPSNGQSSFKITMDGTIGTPAKIEVYPRIHGSTRPF